MAPAPRVVYWDNLPAPYVVERFNVLAARKTIDFSAWFSRRRDPDRSWDVDESAWRFDGSYVADPAASLRNAHDFARLCDEIRPDLIVSLYGERAFVAGHAILKGRGIRTALRVLPTFDAWIPRALWKESLKHTILRSADAAKVPGGDGRHYAARYGMPAERSFFVTQSIDTERYRRDTGEAQRQRERARLGVGTSCMFLYVGRFWRGKGLEVLIAAFKRAKSLNRSITLVLVGDGADEARLRRAAAGTDGVIFEPFAQASVLPRYYFAADVFVFPTLGDPHGLVIEEAQAAGLPVISSDAAGDVRQRVIHGRTGFVVPAGDASMLAERMVALSHNAHFRVSMGSEGELRARMCSHEAWAADFERFVDAALVLAPRATSSARIVKISGRVLSSVADVAAGTGRFADRAAQTGLLRATAGTVAARMNRLALAVGLSTQQALTRDVRLERFGSVDGGWLLPPAALPADGICYCAGVGEDTSLETDLLRRTSCHVWAFDPTPRAVQHVAATTLDRARFRFMPVGVWDANARMRFFAPAEPRHVSHSILPVAGSVGSFDAECTTIPALMQQLGHDSLALLKLNIEGAEWRVLQHIIDAQVAVRILCVEFCQSPRFWKVLAMVRMLRRSGYHVIGRRHWKFTFSRAHRPAVLTRTQAA